MATIRAIFQTAAKIAREPAGTRHAAITGACCAVGTAFAAVAGAVPSLTAIAGAGIALVGVKAVESAYRVYKGSNPKPD